MPGPEHCIICDRPMCRCQKCVRPPGWVRHEARGYCKACYVASRPRKRRRAPSGPRALPTVDTVLVDRAIAGLRPTINYVERSEAIRHLDKYRLSAATIADRLGCSTRTVQRHRARLRAAQPREQAA